MNLLTHRKRRMRGGLLCLLPLLSLLLAGCTGSGTNGIFSRGGGGGTPVTLSGTLQSSDGAPLSGFEVVYDPTSAAVPPVGSGTTTTTNAQGQFSFSVSSNQVTGSDTVSVFDSAGHLVTTTSVTPGQPMAVITVTPVPPTPPAQQF